MLVLLLSGKKWPFGLTLLGLVVERKGIGREGEEIESEPRTQLAFSSSGIDSHIGGHKLKLWEVPIRSRASYPFPPPISVFTTNPKGILHPIYNTHPSSTTTIPSIQPISLRAVNAIHRPSLVTATFRLLKPRRTSRIRLLIVFRDQVIHEAQHPPAKTVFCVRGGWRFGNTVVSRRKGRDGV